MKERKLRETVCDIHLEAKMNPQGQNFDPVIVVRPYKDCKKKCTHIWRAVAGFIIAGLVQSDFLLAT